MENRRNMNDLAIETLARVSVLRYVLFPGRRTSQARTIDQWERLS